MRKVLLLLTLPGLLGFASAQTERPLKVKMPQLQSATSSRPDSFIRGVYGVAAQVPQAGAAAPKTDSFIRSPANVSPDSFIRSPGAASADSFIRSVPQEKALRVKITTVPAGQSLR